ncbi:MAG: CoA transferase, partial [Candidatus Dormibacteraeota bacterium]|nr:CoA transferase [Candidatus Dormibacteraeota bacterium]
MERPPLFDVRVLEVGNYMAGPFCAMQLADLGADVLKVEQPEGGDEVRQAGPFLGGQSSHFLRLNRNKRSLALDLKAPEGKEVFRRLVSGADVVVENLRPGTMRRLELDYPRLAELNPRLIYVAASGWGQDGPLSPLAGLDIMAQARGGLMSITGTPDGDPVKVGVPVCDLVCALYGALAAVSALRARERTGRGQYIDVCLLEAGVSLAVWEAGRYFATGEVPRPLGSAHQANAPYQAVRSSDGWFTIGAASGRNWVAFCGALGLERLLDDPRYV